VSAMALAAGSIPAVQGKEEVEDVVVEEA